MEKDIKKLLSKGTLNGEDVGRLMILDLIAAYRNLPHGGNGAGVLSNAQKIEIVSTLTTPEDISRYNDFRSVHDYLMTCSAVYDSYAKTFELYHWKLSYLLNDMNFSEEENIFLKSSPVIMTELQYKHFSLSGEPLPNGGIAVLREVPAGFVPPDLPAWRERFCAESILENYTELITESLQGIRDTLAECLARKKMLELVGRYIKVPQIKTLIPPIEEGRLSSLNSYMTNSVNAVSRDGGEYERALKKRLSELFTPINIEELSPEPNAVKKARRFLSFDVIKNGSEAFVGIIKREWRNDCAE